MHKTGTHLLHLSRVRQLCVKYLAKGYKGTRPLEGGGDEPATLELKVERSTTEQQATTCVYMLQVTV